MEEKTMTTLNQEHQETDTSEMDGKYLTFWTDKQLFAMPIADVVQIIGIQEITPIPEFPYYAKGIINLRGSIIPIIDVRLRFGKEEIPYDEHTCIIVTNVGERFIGVIVDAVNEVTTIDEENISPPPQMAAGSADAFLTGIGKQNGKVVLLLDLHKVLGEESFEGFSL